MAKNNIHVLEEMRIPKAIMHLALPSVLSMLVNVLYNLTDTFFIGKLNDPVQVAAVSIAFPLFTFQMAIAGIFGNGGGSYVSRLLGRKDYARAKETTTTAVVSSLAASVFIGIAGILLIPAFLRSVGASAAVSVPATQYLTYILAGSPIVLLNFTLVQLIRAEGAANKAMIGLFIGTGANILLDPLFIFVFGMGVVGAAVATVIGQALGMAYYLHYYLAKHSPVSPSRRYLRPRLEIYREIFFIGIPASLGQVMMSLGNALSLNLASAYGDVTIASLGVASRVFPSPSSSLSE